DDRQRRRQRHHRRLLPPPLTSSADLLDYDGGPGRAPRTPYRQGARPVPRPSGSGPRTATGTGAPDPATTAHEIGVASLLLAPAGAASFHAPGRCSGSRTPAGGW